VTAPLVVQSIEAGTDWVDLTYLVPVVGLVVALTLIPVYISRNSEVVKSANWLAPKVYDDWAALVW